MNREDRLEVFKKELEFIKNKDIRKFAEEAIAILPDYIFHIPSSSTMKYHPQYALGEGGLIKHMRACARFAMECFRLEWYDNFTDDEKDLIITILLIHDGAKSGIPQQEHTIVEHPILLVSHLDKHDSLKNIISEDYLQFVYRGISSHMGGWNFDKEGNEVMPKPKTKAEKLIHFIDYVCSRKMFEVNFDAPISR